MGRQEDSAAALGTGYPGDQLPSPWESRGGLAREPSGGEINLKAEAPDNDLSCDVKFFTLKDFQNKTDFGV